MSTDLLKLQERLHRLGYGVGDIDDLALHEWSPQATELVQDLVYKLELAEDQIRDLGGNPPF